ncbi:MAG: GNAT family N-acetyltransferase [Deltaproteobacteria bacterium]|nr:GNAT family N-acetyltransferase [Deltaproteobacteria bacterium]
MIKQYSHDVLYGGNPSQGIGQKPLIINVCLSGNISNREINPHIPVSIQEITENAAAVIEAGASILHVHAYDSDGVPTWHPEIFGRIFETIRSHYHEVVLVATTSGRLHGAFAKRSAVLELDGKARPDMASLTLTSLNFPKQASINEPETVQALCQRMREKGIMPELEAFDLGMLNYAFYLQRKGLLPLHCYINLLLGSLGTVPGRILDLANLVREIPQGWTWAAAGIGRYQLPINIAAIAMGGNVRVGLEDNPFYSYSERDPARNEDLVKRLVRIAGELGRTIATPQYTRRQLCLGDHDNWAATLATIRKMKPEDLDNVMAILSKWNMAPVAADSKIPDPERDRIEIDNTFVAELQGSIVGVASYFILSDNHAETASLAVNPEFLGCGIGFRLQEARLEEMRNRGIQRLRTESDRPEVIHWYVNKFGYRITGKNHKKHLFGDFNRDHWTVLELDLSH